MTPLEYLRKREWSACFWGTSDPCCPECSALKPRENGHGRNSPWMYEHRDDCELAALLREQA